jgi:hypothetical protein
VPGLHISVAGESIWIDSLILTPSGLRGRGRSEMDVAATPVPEVGAALSQLMMVDDAGRSYRLTRAAGAIHTEKHQGRPRRRRWEGEWGSEPAMAGDTVWLELHASGSQEARPVILSPLPSVPSGPAAPPWPTPAEAYLAWLTPETLGADPAAIFGIGLDPREATEVVAAVADALLTVGALPSHTAEASTGR